jgi:hypothetical protein
VTLAPLRTARQRAVAGFVRLSSFADSRRGAATLFLVALGAYWIEAIAWPLQRGRDSWDYWLYWLQMGDAHPPFSWVMLFRTPLTPIVTGLPMSLGGARLLEVVMSLIFAASVVGWAWAARPFGRKAAVLVAVAVLVLQVPYAALFHEVSSDFLFGAVLAFWSGVVVRAVLRPSSRLFVAVGAGAALLTLTRPAGQVLVIVAAVVALVAPGSLRGRIAGLVVVVLAALVPLAGWAAVNDARYGDFTVARGGKAWVPFYKVHTQIDPANGPASKRLADAIARDVITLPQYRRQHVDTQTYLRVGANLEVIRMIALSDRVFGRSSGYGVLYDAAVEAIRRHPGAYVDDVATTMWKFTTQRFSLGLVTRNRSFPAEPSTMLVDGKPFPSPTSVSPVLSLVRYGFVWCPTDDFERCVVRDPSRVFASARDQRRYVSLVGTIRDWNAQLPLRNGNVWLAQKLGTVSWNTPPSFVWIVLALAGIVAWRPRGWPALVVLLVGAGLVLLVHALSQAPQSEYELPLAPLFVVAAVAAFASASSPWRRRASGGDRAP